MNNVKDTVLNKIKNGEVAMRPRWHFVLKSALALIGMFIITLWLIYLVSFIVFALVASGVVIIPTFGFNGLVEFLLALPWLLILVATMFVILLEILVNKYSFGYRKPLLYTLFGVIGLTVFGTFIVSISGIHNMAMQRSIESRLPLVGGVYRGYGIPLHENIHIGEIESINERGFILDERAKGRLLIVVKDSTKKPRGAIFRIGDHVIVYGHGQAGEIEAIGVRYFLGKIFKPIDRIENKFITEMMPGY